MKVSQAISDNELQLSHNPTVPSKDTFSRNSSHPSRPEPKPQKNPVAPIDKLCLSKIALNTFDQEQAPNQTPISEPTTNSELSLDERLQFHLLRNLFLSIREEDYSPSTYLAPPSKESIEKLKSLIQQAQISIKGNPSLSKQSFDIQMRNTSAIFEKGQIHYTGDGVIRTRDGQNINFDIKLNLNPESAEIYNIPIPGKKGVPKNSAAAEWNQIV